MTRKDYQLVADAIRTLRTTSSGNTERTDALGDVAWSLASKLSAENPRFDRARFLAACGVTDN